MPRLFILFSVFYFDRRTKAFGLVEKSHSSTASFLLRCTWNGEWKKKATAMHNPFLGCDCIQFMMVAISCFFVGAISLHRKNKGKIFFLISFIWNSFAAWIPLNGIHLADTFLKVCIFFCLRLAIFFIFESETMKRRQKFKAIAFSVFFSSLLPANDYISLDFDTFVDLWPHETGNEIVVSKQQSSASPKPCSFSVECIWLMSFIRLFVMCWHCRLGGIWATTKKKNRATWIKY